jgi:OmpA-OmpF porin, OOP family
MNRLELPLRLKVMNLINAKQILFAVLLSGLAACSSPGPVLSGKDQLPSAHAEQNRITDGVIRADRKYIASLQARLGALNAKGRPADDYFLSKATAWLDFATEEYSDNDRGGIVEQTLAQALALIKKMEAGDSAIDRSTVIVPAAKKIRPDLWAKFSEFQGHREFTCVAGKVAQGEVQLVWAGHEELEGGWRHAKPYIEIVESIVQKIDADLERCAQSAVASKAVPTVAAAVAAVVPEPPVPVVARAEAPLPKLVVAEPAELFSLATDALFAFDKSTLESVLPEARTLLGEFVAKLRQFKTIQRILITGHTDRLGSPAYNSRLSEARAQAIRQFLIQEGFAASLIQVAGAGEGDPLVTCSGDRATPELQSCLQVNRRVEVRVKASR